MWIVFMLQGMERLFIKSLVSFSFCHVVEFEFTGWVWIQNLQHDINYDYRYHNQGIQKEKCLCNNPNAFGQYRPGFLVPCSWAGCIHHCYDELIQERQGTCTLKSCLQDSLKLDFSKQFIVKGSLSACERTFNDKFWSKKSFLQNVMGNDVLFAQISFHLKKEFWIYVLRFVSNYSVYSFKDSTKLSYIITCLSLNTITSSIFCFRPFAYFKIYA